MRGTLLAIPAYAISLASVALRMPWVFHNSMSFQANLLGLVIAPILLLLLTWHYIKKFLPYRSSLVILFHLVVANIANSTFITYFDEQVAKGLMTDDGAAITWIIQLPLVGLTLLMFGICFDVVVSWRNKHHA